MLTQAVESYIACTPRHGIRVSVRRQPVESFAAFSDAAGKHHICSETAIEWAGSAPSLSHTSTPAWTGDPICAVHSRGGPTP